jgi:cell division protease FtsH
VINGEPLNRDDDSDDSPDGDTPSLTAVPKTKPKAKPIEKDDGAPEPEPT